MLTNNKHNNFTRSVVSNDIQFMMNTDSLAELTSNEEIKEKLTKTNEISVSFLDSKVNIEGTDTEAEHNT